MSKSNLSDISKIEFTNKTYHTSKGLSSVSPSQKIDFYLNEIRKYSQDKLLWPTTSQVFSFIYFSLLNYKDPCCNDLLLKLRNNCLWTYTENMFIPEGVFVYDSSYVKPQISINSLFKLSENSDPKVNFIPAGFKTGEHSISEFLHNPFALAHTGKDNIGLVERVVKLLGYRPYVKVRDCANSKVKTYTALYCDKAIDVFILDACSSS